MKDLFDSRRKKPLPYSFVLEAISKVVTETRPMFGSLAVYVGEKIVFILRDKRDGSPNDGVWLATTAEHHESLRREFPNMRSIRIMGKDFADWQLLAVNARDFEEAALRACELVLAGDPRIGKVPESRRKRFR